MGQTDVRVTLSAQVSGYVAGMQKATQETEKTRKATEDAIDAYTRQNEAMERAGKGLLVAGAAMSAATALTIRSAMKWESAWAGVTKTVDGTPRQLQQVEEGLRSLTKVLPSSHEEIASVAEAAGQLGVQTDNVIAFTRTMIDLGQTTNLSATDAATQLARFMNVMGTSQDQVSNLGSAVVDLGNNYATTEAEIVAMAQRLSGAGRQIGMTEGDVLGLSTALSSVGIEAEAGGSAISKVMIDIASSADAGGDRIEMFAKVAGMSAKDFTKQWETSPGEALAAFVQGLANAESQGQSTFAILADLGITEVRMRDALLRSAAASDQFSAAMAKGNQAFEENNALAAEAEKRYQTTESKLAIMANRINDAAIDMGAVFLPIVNALADAVGGLADGFSDLPEPLQEVVGVVTAVAGAAALAGGTFLLAVPKIAEFQRALAILATSQMPAVAAAAATTQAAVARTGTVMAGLAKFLTGPWGIALAAGAVGVGLLTEALRSMQATSKEVENTLKTAETAAEIFDTIGKGREASWWHDVSAQLKDLDAVLEASASKWKNPFQFDMTYFGAFDALKDIGEELSMLATKDLPTAQNAFRLLADETDGTDQTLWRLLSSMPKYKDALIDQATALDINVTSSDEAANKQALLELALGNTSGAATSAALAAEEAASAMEEAAAASEEWRSMVADADAAFIDLTGAYDTVIQKNQEIAQSTADATEDAADSWEDYYDGVSVAFEDYLAELEAQVAAQEEWESNMIRLAGRVSQGTLDELARLGPQAAPLVADMVDASAEELGRLDAAFAQKGEEATNSFASQLELAQTVVGAAAAQLGEEAAREVAAKLADGSSTVEQIIREYGIRVAANPLPVGVDTDGAQSALDNFVYVNNGRRITFFVDGQAGRQVSGSDILAKAAGGAISGAGGPKDDAIPAWLSNGEHVLTAEDVAAMGGQDQVYAWRRALHRASGGAVGRFASGGSAEEREAERIRKEAEKAAQKIESDKERQRAWFQAGLNDWMTAQRRGENRAAGMNGGGLSLVDELLRISEQLSGPQAKKLRESALRSEKAFIGLEKASDKAASVLEKAKDKLADLKDAAASMVRQVSDAVRRFFDLGSLGESTTTSKTVTSTKTVNGMTVTSQGVVETTQGPTSKSIAAGMKSQASRIKAFASKLTQLSKKGLAPQLLAEIASLGVENGEPIVDALLTATKAEISSINSSYKTINSASDAAGKTVADANYKGQIEAAEKQVKAAQKNADQIEAALRKETDRIIRAITDNLKAGTKKAYGGPVFGPGGPTDDLVNAALSNGEHVWTASEVQAAGGHGAVAAMRQSVKSGHVGYMRSAYPATLSGGAGYAGAGGDSVEQHFHLQGTDPRELAREVVREMRWA